jgi:parallel beta-helix repeat protein
MPNSLRQLPHRARDLGFGLALAVSLAVAMGPTVAGSGGTALASEACQERTITARADADAWIDQGSPFANKGSDAILSTRSAVPDKNARALIRFGLPAAPPPGCVVELAKLRLFAASGDESRRLEATRLGFGWSESLVTWGDQPDTVGAPATTWAGEGYIEWTVTSQVQGMLEGANHGFLIRDETEDDEAGGEQDFHSREKGENNPELMIRFAAPGNGEPSGPPKPPKPAAVRCGQELLESTLVTNDLSECPGDGLVIGDERITVDLGGHTIDGVGLGTGVRNNGYDSVTVRNGTVQEFDFGVQLLPETDRNLVEGLSLRQNQLAAIQLSDTGTTDAGNEVRANSIDQNGEGIALIKGATGTLVTGNTITLNNGPGLRVSQSDRNRLDGNSVSGSGDLGVDLEQASDNTVVGNSVSSNSDGGIEIVAASNGNRVEDNLVSQSGDHGILVAESDRNELIGNTAELMSDSGITLNTANEGVVQGNDVRFNSGGIQMDGSSRNLVEANVASETTGIGIELGGGSLQNRVVANLADDNGSDGIDLSDEAPEGLGNLLDGNTASGNSGDGIATGKGGHTLSSNVANENGSWGINAAPGTVDGGRNSGVGNRKPEQCIGVVCSSDREPPETTITDQPDSPTSSTSASFSFDGSDPGSAAGSLRFECRLDGESFRSCESPQVYGGLRAGPHSFEVRAIDVAGNADPTPASHAWTVANGAPNCVTTTVAAAAEADSWVLQSSPTSNYGNDSVVKVDTKGGGNARVAVRFALPAAPAGCRVVDAKLRLYASSYKAGRTLQALGLAAPWTESGLTWSNQPATAETAASVESAAGHLEWTVTPQAQSMYSDGNHGFLIRDSVESGGGIEQGFNSREKGADNPPELIVTFG